MRRIGGCSTVKLPSSQTKELGHDHGKSRLACASVLFAVQADVDDVAKVPAAVFFGFFLGEGAPGDNCCG